MGNDESMKSVLQQSLDRGRTNLRWKLSGLDERGLRWPRTPTGFNLLGALKHMAQVEIVYFGGTFGRAWPNPDELVTDADIVREGIDGAAGLAEAGPNLPQDFDQDAYLERLRSIADRF